MRIARAITLCGVACSLAPAVADAAGFYVPDLGARSIPSNIR
mgnify:CR=1 FL=1